MIRVQSNHHHHHHPD
ncbi:MULTISPECIES: his operon leader peptide [Tatumella]|nr:MULTISPECIES: his operon leader peptide [Tatumella]